MSYTKLLHAIREEIMNQLTERYFEEKKEMLSLRNWTFPTINNKNKIIKKGSTIKLKSISDNTVYFIDEDGEILIANKYEFIRNFKMK